MLTLPPSVRIYVVAEPTGLRKRFDGLSVPVAHSFEADPLCGHLFVFRIGEATRSGSCSGNPCHPQLGLLFLFPPAC
ncbi:IS66 family insertion sequence element accessory protein TnpB [Sorangium sp. So ce1014]|uniref:IS66 family insertion sequence element accessory protein TnpB n=1 Tax=Sorangium sp. So ce1014 TaxID=3133326 RepID=UPI003F616E01